MTKKGKKRLLIALGVVVVAVGLFTVAVYGLTSEHPDYVIAAKGLEKARKEAEKRFGPLDHGNAHKGGSDNAAWAAIDDSIPRDVSDATKATSALPDYKSLFSNSRSWYETLPSRIEPLQTGFTDQTDISEATAGLGDGGMVTGIQGLSIVKNIGKTCQVGVIGAADAGDAAAVRYIGRTGALLVDKLLKSERLIYVLVADAIRSIVTTGLMTGLARNATDAAIREACVDALDALPPLTSALKLIKEDALSQALIFQLLRSEKQRGLDESIDEMSGACPVKPTRIEVWIQQSIATLAGRKATSTIHRVGRHTVDALEARYWETATSLYDATLQAQDDLYQAQLNVSAVSATVRGSSDRSYEIAAIAFSQYLLNSRQRNRLSVDSARASAILVDRSPDPATLPNALPSDLVFIDPFTGKPIQYQRLSDGFIIYSLGENKKQDNALIDFPPKFSNIGNFIKFGQDGDDWGFAVKYPKG